jgi:hypothetical protein
LPYGGYAPPASYEVNGRQYILTPASGGGKLQEGWFDIPPAQPADHSIVKGGEPGDAYVAFALFPD